MITIIRTFFTGAKFATLVVLCILPLSAQVKKTEAKVDSATEEKCKVEKKVALKLIRSSDASKEVEQTVAGESESDRIFRRDLILQINEVVKKVQKDYPVLSKKLDNKKQKEIIKSLVSTLNCGMSYVSAGDQKQRAPKRPTSEPQPAIMLAFNKILYIRIDSFSKNNLTQLKKDCDNCAKFAEETIGVIIDLRTSQGNNCSLPIHATALFATTENMEDFGIKSPLKQKLIQPVIILTGAETQGASEIFTQLLVEMKRAINLGEKTAGIPFTKKIFTLSNGDYLLIPQVPQKLENILPMPIKPSIKFSPYPQVSYDKLKKSPDAEQEDKCIQRAVELILCLDAMNYE